MKDNIIKPSIRQLHQTDYKIYKLTDSLESIKTTFYIENISRGVLYKLAKNKDVSLSVRSTRYTMGKLLMAYVASTLLEKRNVLIDFCVNNKVFVNTGRELELEIHSLAEYLKHLDLMDLSHCLIKTSYYTLNTFTEEKEFFDILSPNRNVGDNFKHIVNDNWSTNLTVTMGLDTLMSLDIYLENGIDLRDLLTEQLNNRKIKD